MNLARVVLERLRKTIEGQDRQHERCTR